MPGRVATTVFLAAREPFDGEGVLRFLAARAIDGVEDVRDGTYRRTLSLAHGPAILACTPRADGVRVTLSGHDPRDEPDALRRVRDLFGLDADPQAMAAALGADPVLGPLVAARPGLRVPGAADGFEIAVRAVLGQQITVVAARRLAGSITARLGSPLHRPEEHLTHLFPRAAALAGAPDEALPMPRSRARAVRALGAADPRLLDPADADHLQELPGIGPWTAGYVALRLGDPDVFLPGDVAVRGALERLGLCVQDTTAWSPWRSFCVVYLWAAHSDLAGG